MHSGSDIMYAANRHPEVAAQGARLSFSLRGTCEKTASLGYFKGLGLRPLQPWTGPQRLSQWQLLCSAVTRLSEAVEKDRQLHHQPRAVSC